MQTAGDGSIYGGDVREYNRINFLSMVSRGIEGEGIIEGRLVMGMREYTIRKEWIGKRRIGIYLLWRNCYYSFCWVQLIKDGSFSFGFKSKTLRFTEWGSAVVRSGYFTEHLQTLASGNVDIKNVTAPHVTFHSPAIQQKRGIVHFVGSNGEVDEWELDWFPVRKAQALLYTYTGDIAMLEKTTKPKGRYEIAVIPSNIQCLRMELIIHPLSATAEQVEDRNAITNILGFCPNYIVSCWFYENNLVAPALYMLVDS